MKTIAVAAIIVIALVLWQLNDPGGRPSAPVSERAFSGRARIGGEASPDGRFVATLESYTMESNSPAQITLEARVVDSVGGDQRIQLFRVSLATAPSSLPSHLKVSKSGRVYAIINPDPALMDPHLKPMCLLQVWDPSGQVQSLNVLDLEWFAGASEARDGLNLMRSEIELEGPPIFRSIKNVPVPTYQTETITFKLRGSRTRQIYVSYVDDQTPILLSTSRPIGHQ